MQRAGRRFKRIGIGSNDIWHSYKVSGSTGRICFFFLINLLKFGFTWLHQSIQMRKCMNGEKKISIAKHRSLMPLAVGNIDVSIDGSHDTVSRWNLFQIWICFFMKKWEISRKEFKSLSLTIWFRFKGENVPACCN